MSRYITYVTAIALAIHGLIHFLGIGVYFELIEMAGLPYKTTLLAGAVDVGAVGIRVFAVLTAIAGLGIVASGVALVTDWYYWRGLLLVSTVLSLVLTTLDWTVASMGVLANFAILSALFGLSRLEHSR